MQNCFSRYGGQYLTPEQLPEFCDQLHHLVEVIRNIESYAKVTGEYPRYLKICWLKDYLIHATLLRVIKLRGSGSFPFKQINNFPPLFPFFIILCSYGCSVIIHKLFR